MTDPLTEGIADGLRPVLLQGLERAISSYQAFIATAPDLDAKAFKEYHAAARACLAELELLLRLTRPAAAEDSGRPQQPPRLDHLIDQARQALRDLRAHQPESEEDDEAP